MKDVSFSIVSTVMVVFIVEGGHGFTGCNATFGEGRHIRDKK